MNPHLAAIATGFRYVGLTLGIPGLVAFLSLAGFWTVLRLNSGTPASSSTSIAKDGLVGLLVAGAEGMGKVLGFLNGAATWVFAILAVVALMLTLFGATLYLTGRGLASQAVWARVVCMLLGLFGLLVSLLAMLSLPGRASLAALLTVCASGYTVWVMIRRFS